MIAVTMPRVVAIWPSKGEICPDPWIRLIGVNTMSSSMMVPDLRSDRLGDVGTAEVGQGDGDRGVAVDDPVLGTVSTLIRYGVAALSSSVTLAGPV